MVQPTVLVVDDDPVILKLLQVNFELEGFRVLTAGDGREGVDTARAEHPDVVISDIMMPNVNGLELLAQLKSSPETENIPVVLLSAKAQEADVQDGLDRGADDYVTKPFSADQLDARIRAVLRRAHSAPEPERIELGGLVIDRSTRVAELEGEALELSRREFDLLWYLARRAGTVVTKRELVGEVWRQPYGGADRTVDVHLSWLRRKLGETAAEPKYLHTVRGVGVKLVAPGHS